MKKQLQQLIHWNKLHIFPYLTLQILTIKNTKANFHLRWYIYIYTCASFHHSCVPYVYIKWSSITGNLFIARDTFIYWLSNKKERGSYTKLHRWFTMAMTKSQIGSGAFTWKKFNNTIPVIHYKGRHCACTCSSLSNFHWELQTQAYQCP